MTVDPKILTEMLPMAADDLDLYIACRKYIWRYDCDNNPNPVTNGELRLLQAEIPAARTVFDVGAHVGSWTQTVLSINPAVRIHAFEPSARTFAELEAKQLPSNVVLRRLALGDAAEQRELHLFGEHSELSSLYRREAFDGFPVPPSIASETVTVTTLDRYCAEAGIIEIDFLKIDAEGHDLKVLRGARDLLTARAVNIVQFEYGQANLDSRDLLKDFFAFFAEIGGYDMLKLRAEGFAQYPRYDARLENFTYQTWIVAREIAGRP